MTMQPTPDGRVGDAADLLTRAAAAAAIAAAHADAVDRDGRFPEEAVAAFRSQRLLGAAVPFAWRFWEYSWTPPAAPGRHTLQARATDHTGRTQPTTHDPDRRNYMINKVSSVEVFVM